MNSCCNPRNGTAASGMRARSKSTDRFCAGVRRAAPKALRALPSVLSLVQKNVRDELPSDGRWLSERRLTTCRLWYAEILKKALGELPFVVSWLSRKALNEMHFVLLVQLQQVSATHARRPNPLSATTSDGIASLAGY